MCNLLSLCVACAHSFVGSLAQFFVVRSAVLCSRICSFV